jgi:amino acid permease
MNSPHRRSSSLPTAIRRRVALVVVIVVVVLASIQQQQLLVVTVTAFSTPIVQVPSTKSLLLLRSRCCGSSSSSSASGRNLIATSSFRHHANAFPQQQQQTATTTTTTTTTTTSITSTATSTVQEDDTPNSNAIGTGTATISNEIFNLVKSIVGAGVLSLSYGIATYGNAPSAILPAMVLITLVGILSGYGFGLIGRVCSMTQTTSYKSAWEVSISPQTSWIPALAVTFKTICATLAYSMILGDTFHSLLLSAGITTLSKTMVLIGITSTILLPLCLLQNLSSLAPFSLLGSLGMVYTAIAMLIRYLGPMYKVHPIPGLFLSDVPLHLQPQFGSVGARGVLSPVTTILLGMLSTSYMAHFNAPKFFVELQNNTVSRFLTVVAASFGISIGLFVWISTVGFLTFGSHASSLILNNYSHRDMLMSVSRIAVAISLVGSYPLAFVGARDGILDVLSIRPQPNTNNTTNSPSTNQRMVNTITVALLSTITTAALVIPDVSFVLAFAGYVFTPQNNNKLSIF